MNSPILYIWRVLISILGMSGYAIQIFLKMVELFANSGDPDQMPHSVETGKKTEPEKEISYCISVTISKYSQLNVL